MSSGLTFVIGENGAGKTTLIRALLGLVKPMSGSVWVAGRDQSGPSRGGALRTVGYLPQAFRTPEHVTLGTFLRYMAWLRMVPRAETTSRARAAAAKVGLESQWDARLGSLSGGMLRRAGVAQALVHDPSVVLLDEPTAGLDPTSRIEFRRLVAELASDTAVLLSTHLLEDATVMGGTLVALRDGTVVFTGPTSTLLERARRDAPRAGMTALESAFVSLLPNSPR